MNTWILCWKVYMLDKIVIRQESEKRSDLRVIWMLKSPVIRNSLGVVAAQHKNGEIRQEK